jgi:hypothetical protein
MADAPFTESDVKKLLKKRKFVYRLIEDNREESRTNPAITEVRVKYEIRTIAEPNIDIKLRFSARLSKTGPVKPFPGIALFWYRNKRVRGISWAVHHGVVKNDAVIDKVHGWYEHQWTDSDEDRFIVDINKNIERTDLFSMVNFCLKRWNIKEVEQLRLKGVSIK